MSTFNCCLCCQPANEPPDEYKTVLTNLIQFFNTFQSCRVSCIKLEKLLLCKSCWIYFLRVRQLDHEKHLKTEVFCVKKAFLSSKIRRAQQSLLDSVNLTSCIDSQVKIPASAPNDDNDSNVGGQSLDSDSAESISCPLDNTDVPDDDSLKSCETAKVITTDSAPVSATLAEKESTEVTSNDTGASDSESQPPKPNIIIDNVSTSPSSPERELSEATSTDTSDSESDWEPAKRKTKVRLFTFASSQHKEPTEATSDHTSDSDSEPEPVEEMKREYKCRFCPKLYHSASGRCNHVKNDHSQHIKKLRDENIQRWRTKTESDIAKGDKSTLGTDVWPPKGIVIPDDTPSVKRVSNNKFTYRGEFQFEGNEFGFKCSSCPFLAKFTPRHRRGYVWFNIVCHIKQWHLDASRRAAKQLKTPRFRIVKVASNLFLYGGIPFNKLENDQHECGVCGFTTFVSTHIKRHPQNIVRHIVLKHLKMSKEYVCEVCGSKLKTMPTLRVHQLIHNELTEDQLPSCSICDKKFKSIRSLYKHKRSVHGGEDAKKLICEMCGKRFGTATQLQDHKFSHTGVRTYKCSECGKMFAAYAALYTHQRSHKGKKYTCDICGMDFTQHYSVTRHKKTAHPQ